ncbi:hypothetical protein Tco_0477834 [Tanacetum coccineum]
MAPSGSDALLFDVHNDGVFFFVPLWYENGVVYQLRVTKDKKYDYEGLKIVQYDSDLEAMCEFADAYGKLEMYLARIPQNLAGFYKNLCFDESGGEPISKLRIHENRKKDAGNMSYEELVSWVEKEAQHLKTPPKPKTVSKKVWDSLTPKKSDTDDHNGPLSKAIDDLGRDKIIEEDNIVKDVVDKGKVKMIEEEMSVLARKAMVRNKGIVIEENKNPSVMDSDSSDNEHGIDQILNYLILYSNSESEYSSGEGSSRPKTLYGLDENETILEHEEFMDDLVRKLRDCDDDAELTNSFKLVETRVEKYPTHDQDTHWKNKETKDAAQLKACLTYYGLANGFSLWFYRSSKNQVIVRCERIKDPKKEKQSKWKRYPSNKHDEGAKCPWRCYEKQMTTENSFQVFSLKNKHTCARDYKFGTLVNYKWIGKHFGTKIRMNPDIKLHELANLVMKKYKCIVSPCQCRRAKSWALNEEENTTGDHYDYIRSYAKAILKSNDGSTVRVGVTVNLDDQTLFDRFYVCFSGLKRDERKDLDLPTGNGLTLISDQHKNIDNVQGTSMRVLENYIVVWNLEIYWAASKASYPGTNCEAMENGFSECFNVVLLRVRNKPLITMLEAMRVIVMEIENEYYEENLG